MKRIFLFATILALSIAFSSQSQAQILVVGTLLDSASRQPIPAATLSLFRNSDTTLLRTTQSDSNGYFSLQNDTAKTHLIITHPKYSNKLAPVTCTRNGGPTGLGKLELGKIYLSPAPQTPILKHPKKRKCSLCPRKRK